MLCVPLSKTYSRFVGIEGASAHNIQGLPTNVVTLFASSDALNRALLTEIALFEARLSVADVTHGVMLHGPAPEMNSDTGAGLALLLITTTTTVPSARFVYAESSTPDGAVPEVETRL
jgi:hypothetical protein